MSQGLDLESQTEEHDMRTVDILVAFVPKIFETGSLSSLSDTICAMAAASRPVS